MYMMMMMIPVTHVYSGSYTCMYILPTLIADSPDVLSCRVFSTIFFHSGIHVCTCDCDQYLNLGDSVLGLSSCHCVKNGIPQVTGLHTGFFGGGGEKFVGHCHSIMHDANLSMRRDKFWGEGEKLYYM